MVKNNAFVVIVLDFRIVSRAHMFKKSTWLIRPICDAVSLTARDSSKVSCALIDLCFAENDSQKVSCICHTEDIMRKTI